MPVEECGGLFELVGGWGSGFPVEGGAGAGIFGILWGEGFGAGVMPEVVFVVVQGRGRASSRRNGIMLGLCC